LKYFIRNNEIFHAHISTREPVFHLSQYNGRRVGLHTFIEGLKQTQKTMVKCDNACSNMQQCSKHWRIGTAESL